LRGELGARLAAFLCKRIIVAISKKIKTGSNPAELSKEDQGLTSAVLPMMIMMKCPGCFQSKRECV
jgi:hypothetical protein